jgi:hypothetical protein
VAGGVELPLWPFSERAAVFDVWKMVEQCSRGAAGLDRPCMGGAAAAAQGGRKPCWRCLVGLMYCLLTSREDARCDKGSQLTRG